MNTVAFAAVLALSPLSLAEAATPAPEVGASAADLLTGGPGTPPSSLSAYHSTSVGQSGQVGRDSVAGWVEVRTTLPRAEGVTPGQPRTCVGGWREQIGSELRGEGQDQVEVHVKVERHEEGCVAAVDSYRFDPIQGEGAATGTVPTTLQTWTHVRHADDEPWVLEDYVRTDSSAVVDLGWTNTGIPSADTWACFVYAPPFVVPCPKQYVAAVVQDAAVTGSVDFSGLSTPLAPATGTMYWGVFLP